MIKEAYVEGFKRACAERGVDAEKAAQLANEYQNQLGGNIGALLGASGGAGVGLERALRLPVWRYNLVSGRTTLPRNPKHLAMLLGTVGGSALLGGLLGKGVGRAVVPNKPTFGKQVSDRVTQLRDQIRELMNLKG